jgi:two-component system chemotaxis response regulator CheB
VSAIAAAVIGCSAGGLPALQTVLRPLPADLDIAIVIVSHTPADGGSLLPHLLTRECRLPVCEAVERHPVRTRHVYIAPPNYHLMIEPDFTFAFSVDPKVCNVRPAADVLFETAAWAYRERLAGVVLTGANSDGASGLRAIGEAGGTCIVQAPETAFAEAMPRAAIAAVARAEIMSLAAIPARLVELSAR